MPKGPQGPAAKHPWLVRVGVAHRRLLGCIALGAVVAAILAGIMPGTPITPALAGWDVGVLAYLALAAVMMARSANASQLRANAAAQDEGAAAILILSIVAGVASLGAIFAQIATTDRNDPLYAFSGALVAATIVLSWAFIHTIFALHYAHDYYGSRGSREGLRFPEDDNPDYWDFVYFAFVIGMTFQVSDVAVTHKQVRRTVVAHGVLSFFFSTAVIALAVNMVAGLVQK